MAATVAVHEATDAAPNWNEVSSIRFCTADEHNPGTDNPIPIPDSDYNYSYWKSLALDLSGTFTKINNVRFYTDGAIGWNLGTNGELRVGTRDTGDNGCPDASYDQATGTAGDTGDDMEDATDGHAYYKGQTPPSAPASGYTSGSPLTVDSTDHTGAERTKHVVLQVKVASDATAGDQSNETLTFKYDEI